MENVQILWDFMHMGQALEQADVIVGFGCYDEDIPRRCAELFHRGFAPFVCFSGGLGRNTLGRWNCSEAERFAAIAMENGVPEEDKISYTDYVALLMSSITTIINAISYVLMAFVAISLVVSSIMIGVITYISVLERTKEIGVLRALGASKRDISRVFNAETLVIGFSAGALGILVSLVLIAIINIILFALTELAALKAVLSLPAALILIGISMVLTLIAGLFPASVAAKKDPVVALRTE